MTALVLTVVLAAAIGISLGLLGGGGSILAVPLLVYLAGLPAKEAIATSLLVVGTTSALAVLPHARAGRVRWRTGLIFGPAGMTGAYAGGRLAAYISAGILLTAFAVMMLATAAAMIRGRRTTKRKPVPHDLPVLRVIADGIVIGLITGLVGAGGGFLVPALALLGGLPMPVAVGTSLVVIALKSFAGLAGYLSTVHINWPLAAAVTAAVLGSLAGGRLTGRIQENALHGIRLVRRRHGHPRPRPAATGDQYAAATTDVQRATALAAGEAMLPMWQGTAFQTAYGVFGKPTGWLAIVANGVGLGLYVPRVGLFIAVFSVLFLEIWYLLLARRLHQLGPPPPAQPAHR